MHKWLAIIGVIAMVLIFGLVYLNLFHPDVLSIFGKKDAELLDPAVYLIYGRDLSVTDDGTEKVKIETDLVLTLNLNPETKSVEVEFVPPNTVIEDNVLLRDLYDEKGVTGLKAGVEKVTGKIITYHVGVDFQSFVQLIDQLGGIEVEITEDIDFPKYGLTLAPGLVKLNGTDTLKLLRLKYGSTTNIKRIERQKQVLEAIYLRLVEMRSLSEVEALSDTVLNIREKLETNVESQQIIDGFKFFREGIEHFEVDTLPGMLVENRWVPAP